METFLLGNIFIPEVGDQWIWSVMSESLKIIYSKDSFKNTA